MSERNRRTVLRSLCACCLTAGVPRLFAQSDTLLGGTAKMPGDLWRRASSHANRAIEMSSSITGSLDSLTGEVAKQMEKLEQLRKHASSLAVEIANLKDHKEKLMEEFRNGLFCSGCSQTKSQILAKGETFPHPGQSIVRPTQAQIDAKDRELQSPIDATGRKLSETEKDAKTANDKSSNGLEQIRLGVQFWRTASSYSRLAQGSGASLVLKQLDKQAKDIEANLAEVRRVLPTAKNEDAREQLQQEARNWERLQARNKADSEELKSTMHASSLRVHDKAGDELRRIQSFVLRGPLFARVGGPSDTLIFPSATDPEMGVLYQMGRIPEAGTRFGELASARDFAGEFRRFGNEFGVLAIAMAKPPDTPMPSSAQPMTAPLAAPTPVAAPANLLKTLP